MVTLKDVALKAQGPLFLITLKLREFDTEML